MKDHPDYEMHVTFAVLDNHILELGQQTLDELRYCGKVTIYDTINQLTVGGMLNTCLN